MQKSMNKKQFAALVGRSPRQVSNLIHEGMPAAGSGKKGSPLHIDPPKAVQWLLNRAESRNSSPLSEERRRLVAAQAERAELETAQRKGQLLDIEDVQIVVNEGTAIFVGQKRSMGSRLAGQLAGMTDPRAILKLLNAENDKILQATSDKLYSLAGVDKTN